MNKILAWSIAEKYNFEKLSKYIEQEFEIFIKYKDFLLIENKEKKILIYSYGTIVSWNSSIPEDENLINKLKQFEINPYKVLKEEYFYKNNEGHSFYIKNDVFYIPEFSKEITISISYAISQSIKLNYFEEEIENDVEKTKYIPHELKKYGQIKLSSKEITKLRGELLLTKSLLNLHYDLLDEPDFFWNYPDLLKYYEISKKYLELEERIEILNKKLNVIDEIFEILSAEVNHKHEVFLEWIIIILIVIEVFISVFHDILNII